MQCTANMKHNVTDHALVHFLLAIPVSFLLKTAGPVSLTNSESSMLSSSLSTNVMLFGIEMRVWRSRTKGRTAKAGIII